ncbi:MAG: beta-ribofuranosylaminobenzene 5'-phosphate synthase family protein [Hyphomicrobium sp.]
MRTVASQSATTADVSVTAPARLHLGFLDLNGAIGRRYGSIGLAVDQPATRLVVATAERNSASGLERDRAAKLLDRFTKQGERRYAVSITETIPAHAGLGSGTQLALAIGAAIARIERRELSPADLAIASERGARSGIGLAAFTGGGFIIDGGRGDRERPPPVTMRADFPEDWRVLLIFDNNRAGVSGEAETTAFAGLPEFPNAMAAHICHLVLLKLAPGLIERDLAAFGAAITEIQQMVGWHFAGKQGGSPWTSPAVGRLAARMQEQGATGIGQSSWGPTGFAFVDSFEAAERLYHSLVGDAKRLGLDIAIAKGRNAGALIEAL